MGNLVILSWVTHLITLIALLLKKSGDNAGMNNKKSSIKQFDYTLTWNAYSLILDLS